MREEKGNYGWPDGFEEHLLSPSLSSIPNGREGVAATRMAAQEVSLQAHRLACQVQGFKARTFGWENSHPDPLPLGEGESYAVFVENVHGCG